MMYLFFILFYFSDVEIWILAEEPVMFVMRTVTVQAMGGCMVALTLMRECFLITSALMLTLAQHGGKQMVTDHHPIVEPGISKGTLLLSGIREEDCQRWNIMKTWGIEWMASFSDPWLKREEAWLAIHGSRKQITRVYHQKRWTQHQRTVVCDDCAGSRWGSQGRLLADGENFLYTSSDVDGIVIFVDMSSAMEYAPLSHMGLFSWWFYFWRTILRVTLTILFFFKKQFGRGWDRPLEWTLKAYRIVIRSPLLHQNSHLTHSQGVSPASLCRLLTLTLLWGKDPQWDWPTCRNTCLYSREIGL